MEIKKYQYIDVARAIAILMVVAVHCYQFVPDLAKYTSYVLNYGQQGVQLFFVVSAVTLCLSMGARNEDAVHKFYARRFFRIAPLYYSAIGFYFFWRLTKQYYLTDSLLAPDGYSLTSVLANIFFVHSAVPDGFNFVVPGGWSIGTEMAFYLLFPVLFYFQKKLSIRNCLLFCIAICVMFLFLKCWIDYEIQGRHIALSWSENWVTENDIINLSLLNQISPFLVGICVYRLIPVAQQRIKLPHLVLAGMLLLTSCWLLNSTSYIGNPLTNFVIPILSALAFAIIVIRLSEIKFSSSRATKYFIALGQLSFSMYLVHFFILDVISFIFRKAIFKLVKLPEVSFILLYASVVVVAFFVSRVALSKVERAGVDFGKKLLA